MPKALFITYHFPPSGGSKTRRTLKFLKYLRHFSWEPAVLTVNDGKIFNFDPSLIEEVTDNIPVYRVSDVSLPFGVMKKSPRRDPESGLLSHKKQGIHRFVRRIKTYPSRFIKNWIAIPDEFMTWTLPAILTGVRLVKTGNIDVIYSTAPPFSNHITAMFLKFLTKKPLAIDFRDAWVSNPMRDWKYPN